MRKPSYITPLYRYVAILTAALSVGACTNPFADEALTLNELLGSGWLFAETDEPPHAPDESALYCYGTIGEEDCYREPLLREGGRLVGYQGAPPPSQDGI